MKQTLKQFKDTPEMLRFVEKYFTKKKAWWYFCRFGKYVGGKKPYQITIPKI